MQLSFYKYFTNYLFKARTRQKLLLLAALGLFLSSLSLIVLQSVMGGLQKGLIQRSKDYHGTATIVLKNSTPEVYENFLKKYQGQLFDNGLLELTLEVLINKDGYVQPVILHGLYPEYKYSYLDSKDFSGIILGSDLANKLKASFGANLKIISPLSRDNLLGEIPRQASIEVSDFVLSDLSEIDGFHAWVRIGFLQNLIREKKINQIRVFGKINHDLLETLIKDPALSIRTWEDQNSALMWALGLENNVMLALFISMTLLVSICITTGYLVFFAKVRQDLMSFWILGLSRQEIEKMSFKFTQLLSFFTCTAGLLVGLVFLFLLDHYAPEIMPDIFVERTLPVDITITGLFLSFIIPYFISQLFSFLTLKYSLIDSDSFIKLLRAVG
jgi:lipoprotein-releasing system permease protein